MLPKDTPTELEPAHDSGLRPSTEARTWEPETRNLRAPAAPVSNVTVPVQVAASSPGCPMTPVAWLGAADGPLYICQWQWQLGKPEVDIMARKPINQPDPTLGFQGMGVRLPVAWAPFLPGPPWSQKRA